MFFLIFFSLFSFSFSEEVIYHQVKKGENLESIAQKYKVSVEDIKKWNHLKTSKLKVGQRLLIKKPLSKDSISEKEIVHIVKKGENLQSIARKYKVSIEDIKRLNDLKSDKLIVGQKLLIKGEAKIKEEPKKEETSPSKSLNEEEKVIYHVVKRGESLKDIAQKYGVTIEDIKNWNNLKKSKIYAGQKLVIKKTISSEPEKVKVEKESPKKRPKEIIYTVKPGETLSQIAKSFGVSEEEIIKLNNLKNNQVRSRQRLLIRLPEEGLQVKPEGKGETKTEVKEKVKEEASSLEEAFENLKKEEELLRKKRLSRRDYLKLISQYRHLYLLYPSSEIAPFALLKTADLYYELYHHSLRKEDLLEAAKKYEFFLKQFSNHPLKERAILSLLEIYERELKDFQKAEEIKRNWGLYLKQGKKPYKEALYNETSVKKEKPNKVPELIADLKKVLNVEAVTGVDYTRIIIELNGNFNYQLNLLPERKDYPPRLYVDISPAVLDYKVKRLIDLEDKHLKAVRIGQFDPQTVRVVLDLKSLSDYKVFKLTQPYQLIIDLVGKEKAIIKERGSVIAKKEKPKSWAKKRESKIIAKSEEENKSEGKSKESYINVARQFGLGVRRIMLDPGHGGEDPGAVGPNGLKEKDVVLKLAKMVGKKLEERLGVEVLYTRDKDVFIPLAKRPALANSLKADLFISLHLNASPDSKAKGFETYYLNFTTDPEAMRVAALENRANDQGLADLQDLVKAILANTKLKESRELANKVQKEMVKHLTRYFSDIEDRGVKSAPFFVLVGTRMPAILIEADFITNPVIAKRFEGEDYLEKIAEGIVKGVEAYIQSLKLSVYP
ncbi:MAG: LysM peptidoglycan-binding domain-containing protein [Caldimicrobium sp.]